MNKDFIRQIINVLAVVVMITINILANALPINGQNTGEISDRFQVYFVPAGYVFAIWGIIYIGWIVFAIFQFRRDQKESPRLRRLGYLFAGSNLFNAVWLFTWHYNFFGLSVLVMLSLLALLIASYLRLNVNRSSAKGAEWWSVDLPISIYLGWITVATVANITSWLYSIEWNGFGIPAPIWAVVMIIVASVVGFLVTLTRKDAGYVFVLVWSFIGIAVKQVGVAPVATIAWIGAGLMLILAVYSLVRRQTV